MLQRCKNRKEALNSSRQPFGGREMVALTLLRPGEFDTPYANFREEVAYLERLCLIIRAFEEKRLDDVARVPSLQRVLRDRTRHNVHLLRRRGRLNHENSFRLRVRVKFVVYIAWREFSLYFGMSNTSRRWHWISLSAIVQGCEATKLCNVKSSPAVAYASLQVEGKDDISACLRLVMHRQHIFMAVLVFLNLARTGVVFDSERTPAYTVGEFLRPTVRGARSG